MQQITLRGLWVEGFRSYSSEIKFTFDNTGLHLIQGLNGEGKTTLFSALTWCLYKVNLNNTNNAKVITWPHCRGNDFKGTRVKLLLGIGKYKYIIARHLSYKGKTNGITGDDSLLIFRKEKSDKTPFTEKDILNDPLYKDDGQKFIIQLLGIDSKMFLASVLFGQKMSKLLDTKDADKRDLFERLFDADFIDAIKSNATAKSAEITAIIQRMQQELSELNIKEDAYKQQQEQADKLLSNFTEERKATLADIVANHQQAVAERNEVKEKLAALGDEDNANFTEALDAAIEDAAKARENMYTAQEAVKLTQMDIRERKMEINRYAVKIESLTTEFENIRTTCPTCGSKLDTQKINTAKHKIQEDIIDANASKNSLQHGLSNMQHTLEDKEKVLERLRAVYTAANDVYYDLKDKVAPANSMRPALESRLAVLRERIAAFKDAHEKEKARKPPEINMAHINSVLASIKANKPELERVLRIKTKTLERVEWWIKNAFGANGLKSFIFSSMLNKLNEHVAIYGGYFGISISFGIEMGKASKPFFCKVSLDGRNEVGYEELSGGQQQRAALCICFAMQDLMEFKSSFNISIFDEAAEFLDAEAQEILDTLLRIRSERKAVYVVSHYNMMDLSGATVISVSGGKKGKTVIE